MKRLFFVLMLALVMIVPSSVAFAIAPILEVNDEKPWADGAFIFEDISPGGEPMAFDFKLHNVGDEPGTLTFSMSVAENDIAGAPAPNMSADEFASLIYVEDVRYQYIWLDHPDHQPDGYIGSVRNDLESWLTIDGYFNNDGKVSLYELCLAGDIPYADEEGDQLEAGAEITYFIEFQLGGSLADGVASAILADVGDNSQGDGVSVTIIATLGTDIEESSGNVFQAFGIAGSVENVDTGVTYTTIQDAIDFATEGDTINVAPGTYAEQVVIGKSLTLQGANAGAPATGVRDPESIIDAIGDVAVSVDGVGSITFDGFTVGGFGKAGVVVKNVFVAQIENNIVSATDHSQAPNGIQVGYVMDGTPTTGTIKDNQVSGCSWEDYDPTRAYESEDPTINWTGSGILIIAPNSGLTISGNEVQGNDVGLDIEAGSGTSIEGNDVYGNSYGLVFWNACQSVEFNNIFGNAISGVHRTADPSDILYAPNNWWGQSSGSGDAISGVGAVNAEPWLLTLGGNPFDKTVALKVGWSIASPGAELESWVAVDAEELMYAYDGGGFTTNFTLDPITPIFIKTEAGGGIGFNYSVDSQGIFTTDLEAGWNLIGVPQTAADEEAILSPIRLGANNEVALATLASQGNYNPSEENFYESMLNIGDCNVELHPFDGYWAYMNVAKEFGVVVVPASD